MSCIKQITSFFVPYNTTAHIVRFLYKFSISFRTKTQLTFRFDFYSLVCRILCERFNDFFSVFFQEYLLFIPFPRIFFDEILINLSIHSHQIRPNTIFKHNKYLFMLLRHTLRKKTLSSFNTHNMRKDVWIYWVLFFLTRYFQTFPCR